MSPAVSTRRPSTVFLSALAISALSSAPAAVPAPPGAGTVAATYDGGVITAFDIAVHGRLVGSPYGDPWGTATAGGDPATRADAATLAETSAREIVWSHDAAARAAKDDFRLSDTLAAPLVDTLDGCSADVWRSTIRQGVTTVTLADARRLVASNLQSFDQPEVREVSYIFRSTAGAGTTSRSAIAREMEALAATIDAGGIKFRDAARLYSEAPSASDGGRLGPVTRATRMNPRVMDFFFGAPIGRVSAAAALHNGYYIAYVESARPALKVAAEDAISSPPVAAVLLDLLRDETVSSATALAMAASPGARGAAEALAADARRLGLPLDGCTTVAALTRDRAVAMSRLEAARATAWEPSDADIRDYYKANPQEMKEQGLWKLTRHTVRVTSAPGSAIRNRAAAMAAASRVRADAAATSPTLDSLIEAHRGIGLETLSSLGWIHTTDDEPGDRAILALQPGGLTPVLACPEGACFYRLDAKREQPTATLESRRASIRAVLYTRKAMAEVEAARAGASARLNLKMLWPGGAKP